MKEECKYLFNCFPYNNVSSLLDQEARDVCNCLSDSSLDDSEKLFNVGRILGRTKKDILSVLDVEREKSAKVESNNEREYNNISWAIKEIKKEINDYKREGICKLDISKGDALEIINKHTEGLL